MLKNHALSKRKATRIIRNTNKGHRVLLVSLVVLLTVGIGYTTAYLISRTDTLQNTFIGGVDPYGSFTISKSIDHPYGDDYVIPEGLSFSFQVDLGNECASQTYSGYTADADGRITLNIPAGGSVTLDEIPAGVHAAITEQNIPAGFTPTGGATKEVDIEKATNKRADYVNAYSPSKADNKVKIVGDKTLGGRDWKDSDKFIFCLEQQVGDEWVKVKEKYATREDKTFDFTSEFQSIDFEEIGTYKFRVIEDEGSIGGITYDTCVSNFDVVVSDEDMDGSLEIKKITSTSDNTEITEDETTQAPIVSVGFVNRYAPEGSQQILFNITKIISDTSGQGKNPAGYKFGLYDGNGLIAESATTSASGTVSIKQVFTPEEIGKYHWTLKEIPGSETGVVYDETVYDIEVNIVDNEDGTISAYVYDYKADQETIPTGADNTYKASFENKYDPADAEISIPGVKKLKGRSLNKDEFSFDIYETESTYDITDKKPVDTVSNTNIEGEFSFDLSFSKVGAFYYVVKENASKPLGGVTYDSSEYRIKVVVTDVGGALRAEASIVNAAGENADIVFNNSYALECTKYSLNGTKTLSGKTLESGMFRFVLYKSNSSFNKEKSVGEVTNDKDGSFSFGEFTYSSEGKHCYIVKELSKDPIKGVTYDETVYHVTVEVKDGGEGCYVTNESIIAVNGGSEKSADRVSFTNSYKNPGGGDKDKKNPENDKVKSRSAKTGDRSMLLAWIVMMLFSAAGLTFVFRISKRRARRS